MNDKEYMRLALQLAKKGCGWTSPNPMVGAVVVKEGRIIGQGWHQRYGQAHAERNALASCTEDPQGATLYVTLEPCCHYGKQPPCVDAILDAGIHRVVVGSADPNPLVAGKGIAILRAHGIDVTENVLQEECDALNKVFFHYITTKRPFVSMKYAMTMDGKIATYTGASKWITGEIARNHVQRQRHRFRGIMVGVGTILADDPLLTCRIEGGRDPVRIICDTHLRTPLQSQVVMTAKQVPTILATCCGDPEKQAAYQQAGCRVLCLEAHCGHVNLLQLMEQLGQEQIDSILLEGGGTLNWSALESGIVQQVQAYIAPKLFGGRDAKAPIEGAGVPLPVLEGTRIGDSIAVNGICLTVRQLFPDSFAADVMHETLNRSALAQLTVGSAVNLERAMPANGRFGGHIVAGHVDGVGRIANIRKDDTAIWYTIHADSAILRYVVEKGSITIDGISLTVAAVEPTGFSVSTIPHTVRQTNLNQRHKGDFVNLETDVVGKYIERLLPSETPKQNTLTKEMLLRCGF